MIIIFQTIMNFRCFKKMCWQKFQVVLPTTPCQQSFPAVRARSRNLHLRGLGARAHLSPLHTPVPLAHHTSTKKIKKQFSQKYFQKIISRINFIQKFPTNYSTKLSRFFLCLLDTMCLVHPHFLTVHLQTSHSISI